MKLSQYPKISSPTTGQLMFLTDPTSSGNYTIAVGDFMAGLGSTNVRFNGGNLQIWDSGLGQWVTLGCVSGILSIS